MATVGLSVNMQKYYQPHFGINPGEKHGKLADKKKDGGHEWQQCESQKNKHGSGVTEHNKHLRPSSVLISLHHECYLHSKRDNTELKICAEQQCFLTLYTLFN